MKKKLLTASLLCTLLTAVSACNTVKGLGEDIQSVGEAGEEAIN